MKHFLIFAVLFSFSGAFAQEEVAAIEVNEDDLGEVSDGFKENFFDALSEKARENHDRAIEKLLICERLEPDNGAVQFELAKNYMASNAFAKAETSLLNAIKISGDREWLLDTLNEVYNRQQEFEKAVAILEKLAKINEDYEELLPVAYLRVNNSAKALESIKSLDRKLGSNTERTALKNRLEQNQQQKEIVSDNLDVLEEQLATNPKNEQIYIKLIYGYSRLNNMEKMLEFAEKLEEELPESDKAQLALYKIYLENGDVDKGLESMNRVFESSQLETVSKTEVLKDFIQTSTTNPALQSLLENVIEDFSSNVEDLEAYKVLASYFKQEKQLQAALKFYELGMELNDQDFELIKNTALLYLDTGAFAKAEQLSSNALESYPSQPLLYLINGAALNQTGDAKKALVQLDTGLSYLLDEPQLERDLYGQLAIAYEKLGDNKKAADARAKMKAISN
ncbi:hypothetical protein SAMN05192588_2423 [Nonlabens sp. Hel1_33_55]|uniref:tetratricopeptide repeat protein n=1 Tax=Nonlabens sp. Hel1_33_55 TaxID=1336802 RepID=UPI000875CF7C|nr:hypothetical protein [Nonlabens sp. Hel1_33_55]SCY35099.1 hypothetical protein SAMN05192588_2423 [Nonlabens sp. Hel1_33_55]